MTHLYICLGRLGRQWNVFKVYQVVEEFRCFSAKFEILVLVTKNLADQIQTLCSCTPSSNVAERAMIVKR